MSDEVKKAGGARPGAGRKKGSFIGDAPKTGRIVIACTKDEELRIKEHARESGKSVSRFIVDEILSRA